MQIVSEKLNHLLRANNLSQKDLSKKVGVSKQVINSLCHGKVKNSKALYPIAKFFGVDYNWLMQNEKDFSLPSKSLKASGDILVLDKFHKIPLLSTRMLNKNLLVHGKLNLQGLTDEYEITNDSEHACLFTLMSTNNSLKFRFGDNCTLIFHTNLTAIAGDFVIAYLPDKELFVYRDLKTDGRKNILVPADEDIYKPIPLRDQDIIVAVLYERRIKRASN